jgi:hypothetical protein
MRVTELKELRGGRGFHARNLAQNRGPEVSGALIGYRNLPAFPLPLVTFS